MEKITLCALIKFGSQENIYDLYNNGTIYFSPIESFRILEDNSLRGDNFEGNRWQLNLPYSEIFMDIDGKWVPVGEASTANLRGYREEIKGNIYCMYAIKLENLDVSGNHKYDQRVLEFGTHCVIIPAGKISIFLDKVTEALKDIGKTLFDFNLVRYYNADENGFRETDIFMKRHHFTYQNEFRIFANNEVMEPFAITVSGIKELCTIHKTTDIIQQIIA